MKQVTILLIFGVVILLGFFVYLLTFPGTKNDISIRNARIIIDALDKYYMDHDESPANIQELIEKGYLRKMPRNPWTKKDMEVIPLGVMPNKGDCSYYTAYFKKYNTNTNLLTREYRVFMFIQYGDPDVEFERTKPEYFPFNEVNVQVPVEWQNTIIYTIGGLKAIHMTPVGPYRVEIPDMNEVLLDNGYTLPLAITQKE